MMFVRCSLSRCFSACLSQLQLGPKLHSHHQLYLQKTLRKTEPAVIRFIIIVSLLFGSVIL